MYPMKLTAPLKDYIWGGTKLKTEFGKETDLEKVEMCIRDSTCAVLFWFDRTRRA